MGSQQQFCLRWNNHQSNMLTVFDNLFQNEALVDVTLACEGLSLKAHKMVLSACSPFFQSLFIDNPCKHPIVILKDVRFTDLKALVDFMYKGEVNVSQDQLNRLLKTAETLKVRGLAEVTSGYCIEENGAGSTSTGMAPPPTPSQNSQVAYENSTSRSPQQQQMSPPRKRKKTKHRSRGEKHTSHSEQEDSDGGPEMIEPKVEITEDNFAGEKNSEQLAARHNQESPRRSADDKSDMSFAPGPSASSTPNARSSSVQNQSGLGSLTSVCSTSTDGQLSNQSSLQNASQVHGLKTVLDPELSGSSTLLLCHRFKAHVNSNLQVCLMDNGATDFSCVHMSGLWRSESQDSFEESCVSRQTVYDYDTADEDVELMDIGNDVMVDKQKLTMLLSTTADSPTRFVRGLLMLVFNKEELRGRSVTGRRRHSSCTGQPKDPLECGRLNAVVDYTLGVFPDTSIVKIRQTISNKLKEVNNSTVSGQNLKFNAAT